MTKSNTNLNNSNINESKFLNSLLKGVRYVFILWIINQNKIHGYGIISKLNDLLSVMPEKKTIHGSTIYPILHSLEENGLIKSSEEFNGKNKVKMYEITECGVLALNSIKEYIKSTPENKFFIQFLDDMIFNDNQFKWEVE